MPKRQLHRADEFLKQHHPFAGSGRPLNQASSTKINQRLIGRSPIFNDGASLPVDRIAFPPIERIGFRWLNQLDQRKSRRLLKLLRLRQDSFDRFDFVSLETIQWMVYGRPCRTGAQKGH